MSSKQRAGSRRSRRFESWSGMAIGIEKINLYGGSLVLDIEKLAVARQRDVSYFKNELLIDKKSQLVDYEDVVTMAVNAAKPIISEQDKEDIELCIFATESGLDYCKSNSSYVCRYLGLKNEVRNFEVKNACYAATCGVQMALGWIASGVAPGKKALIVSSDINYDHEGRSGEEVPAVGAVAMIVSDQPKVVEYELGLNGYYTIECTDYARPTSTYDIINPQESLYAYLECFDGAWAHYKSKLDSDVDLNTHFKRIIYHTPFGGLVKLAHGHILKDMYPGIKKKEILANFEEKVGKSLKIPKAVGNTYSSTVYTCLMGLILEDDELEPGDRIGIYSYGSGACAEFYSAKVLPGAREYLQSLGIDDHLNRRYELSIDEFDTLSRKRSSHTDQSTFETDLAYPKGWYDSYYKGQGYLVFKGAKDYLRCYDWS
ncbi:MAG: 3-hydroxy-3-methylglutaryl-ACP synthase [Chitinivibrionales bacterium]|nr:3-hydroxy-3-methylglutaryl-ACP synthase [Chitinivibrionales bacterium]